MTGFTAIFSPVPGPLTPYVINYDEKRLEVTHIYYFVPGAARMAFSLSALTHAGELKMGLLCDKSYFKGDEGEHRRFMTSFE